MQDCAKFWGRLEQFSKRLAAAAGLLAGEGLCAGCERAVGGMADQLGRRVVTDQWRAKHRPKVRLYRHLGKLYGRDEVSSAGVLKPDFPLQEAARLVVLEWFHSNLLNVAWWISCALVWWLCCARVFWVSGPTLRRRR